MAGVIIGRTACPECGFGSAHVRKSEKCLYRYCPECGAPYHAKTERQRADLLAKTRLTEEPAKPPAAAPAPDPTPTGEGGGEPVKAEVTPEPVPTPTPTPTGKKPAKREVKPAPTPDEPPKPAPAWRGGFF